MTQSTSPVTLDSHQASNDKDTSIHKVRELLGKSKSQGGGWEESWKSNATPWDASSSEPSFISTLRNQDHLFPKEGKALVAGCGRGYDVLHLAERGLETVGVDISTTAVAEAREWLSSQPESEARSRSSFAAADFFKLGLKDDVERGKLDDFDMAYDYTFFCAIPPALRTSWASSYARVLKAGGILFTLVYPITSKEGGPHYSVHPDLYTSLLEKDFELIHRGNPLEQKEHHKGIEEVMIWRRR